MHINGLQASISSGHSWVAFVMVSRQANTSVVSVHYVLKQLDELVRRKRFPKVSTEGYGLMEMVQQVVSGVSCSFMCS